MARFLEIEGGLYLDEINTLPYAEWLENSLRNLMSMKIESICICTKSEDGGIGTGYWDCSMADKLVFSGIIQQDAMLETLRENGLVPMDEEDEDNDE